ncbi:hypothetical protein AB0O28_36620 [Microbispora sp. NPDC088329]|uniref:hypothetical protein n=1 Tax=Microbispora sp. NPDC088329 TaxID=3154869 RepID=UPI0034483D84
MIAPHARVRVQIEALPHPSLRHSEQLGGVQPDEPSAPAPDRRPGAPGQITAVTR